MELVELYYFLLKPLGIKWCRKVKNISSDTYLKLDYPVKSRILCPVVKDYRLILFNIIFHIFISKTAKKTKSASFRPRHSCSSDTIEIVSL